MNFINAEEMFVHKNESSPSVDSKESPYKQSITRKKSKYEDNQAIPEQEEPSSTLLFDQSDVKIK